MDVWKDDAEQQQVSQLEKNHQEEEDALNQDQQKSGLQVNNATHPPRRPKSHRHKIVWKRMHVPPSIPVGRNAFGYQESQGIDFYSRLAGDLVPRRAQKRKPIVQPLLLI